MEQLESNRLLSWVFFFCLAAGLASSATISNNVFEAHGVAGRSLLQQQKSCSVDFEHQNYTIITSQCKGPNYNGTICCNAFKELACPFYDQINDLSSECATNLFSYIQMYGRYPPGLFASLCREGKEGLDCSDVLDALEKKNSTSHTNASLRFTSQSLSVLLSVFVTLLLTLF